MNEPAELAGPVGGRPLPLLPRISIVTPSFNQGEFLEKAILSVLDQEYPNLEYIVIDGGSTDSSLRIIQSYASRLHYWVSEPDRGQSHALNKGFAQATGEIFGWLNADDFLLPGALARVARRAASFPDAVAWVGSCHRVDRSGTIRKTIRPRGLEARKLADWSHEGFFYQPSCFFSAEVFRKVGGVSEDLHFAMDVDLWLRLAKAGEFSSFDDVISAALLHDGAKTQAQRSRMFAETVKVQFRHGFDEIAMSYLENLLEAHRLQGARSMRAKARIRKMLKYFVPVRRQKTILANADTPAPERKQS
jgi:glycosyltransferase involved in cell wall biosynthesis